ncbi:glucan biosynthesis protein [Nitrococcus mobilis]|uniref:Periplasmic glucans biosynthesis protein n=1 Tax=Nitrococcus mobilis Nb-231 TaxID=314278 RepID=A4BR92_9GAMM|nr:glucan biosynthesis protein [Nitrococcus mobilis]EAR21714.1 periplasmic glucans biosynthesis protein [Nitrococcus mobilis Nb-231]
MYRVSDVLTLAFVIAGLTLATAVSAENSSEKLFGQIAKKARELAAQPYQAPQEKLPDALTRLSYDQYRDIRFRPERTLWNGQALFSIQLFHLGFLYHDPVTINVVENGQIKTLSFDSKLFDYGKNTALAQHLRHVPGYAGFRIHYPLNTPDYKDEVITFLGASYFRMLGQGQNYGISARGLAIDTGLPSGEEFPRFREFWLVKPESTATTLILYALLDSRSATGAYRMELIPGKNTALEIQSRLFARTTVEKLGVAPLTSMFLHGENRVSFADDYRPEVHDSDGLLMYTAAGEWIWRPLSNPHRLHITELMDKDPRGFGLAQRDRNFNHYLDLETHFEAHPSLWVTPRSGDWGKGAVQLVEIPTGEEINDNIVAFWVPDIPFKAGEQRNYNYRLETFTSAPATEALARVKRTRIGWGAVPGAPQKPARSERQFIVDFGGGELPSLTAAQPVQAVLTQSSGEILHSTVQQLPSRQGWRVAFKLSPDGEQPVDMRLYLTLHGQRLSETWNYVWYPDAIQ